MKKWIKIQFLILSFIGGIWHYQHAQVNKLMEAFDCYQNKNLSCAKDKIDSVVVHSETKEEPGAWSLRAYIYYFYFRNYEYNLYNSKYREIAIESVQKSQELVPDSETEHNNKRLLRSISESYFNQIKIYLYDSLNYDICVYLFNNYKKYYSQAVSGSDLKDKETEFYLSVGAQYLSVGKKLLDSSSSIPEKQFEQYVEIAKIAFNKVLEMESDNSRALEGLAITYYNQGAKLIKEMSYDTPIEQIEQIQENANKYFKQALPYMQKAYENKPDDVDILEGMTGIYYALHDNEKYLEFKKKLDKQKKKE